MIIQAVIALLLGIPSPSPSPSPTPLANGADQALEQVARELAREVAIAWPRTGEIWPGVDFGNNVLLVTNGNTAWAVDRQNLKPVNATTVPRPPSGGFSTQQFEDRPAIVVGVPQEDIDDEAVPDAALDIFTLGTHESFHAYAQDRWESLKQPGPNQSGEAYPVRAEPRLYRMMLANELLAAYESPDQRAQHLSAADYWQTKWATEFGEEEQSLRKADIGEGTAEYFGEVAASMATEGGREYLLETLEPMRDKNKPAESAAIGRNALLVAGDMGKDLKTELMTQNRTPAAALLADVTPIDQTAPEDLRQRLADQTAIENKELAPLLDPFIAAYKDPNQQLLVLPSSAMQAGFNPGEGLFRADGIPVTMAAGATAAFATPSGTFEINGATVGIDGTDFVVPVNGRLSGGKLVVDTPTMKGSISVAQDGRTLRGL